jgi:hypothetical protein
MKFARILEKCYLLKMLLGGVLLPELFLQSTVGMLELLLELPTVVLGQGADVLRP